MMGSQALRTSIWEETPSPLVSEDPETLDAIRKEVEDLPVLDRSLLALHYAGELSPKEIADGMSLSTRTVSMRIRKSLETVNANLKCQGIHLPGQVLSPDYLVAAICTGVPVPQGLREKVLNAVARLEQNPDLPTPPYADTQPRSWGEIGTAFMIVATAAVALWWFAQNGV